MYAPTGGDESCNLQHWDAYSSQHGPLSSDEQWIRLARSAIHQAQQLRLRLGCHVRSLVVNWNSTWPKLRIDFWLMMRKLIYTKEKLIKPTRHLIKKNASWIHIPILCRNVPWWPWPWLSFNSIPSQSINSFFHSYMNSRVAFLWAARKNKRLHKIENSLTPEKLSI